VQQAQHVAQFNVRRIETHNFAANAAQLLQISACTHTATVDDGARDGQRIPRYKRLPVTLNTCFFERECESF
jgi:hypothetical protein